MDGDRLDAEAVEVLRGLGDIEFLPRLSATLTDASTTPHQGETETATEGDSAVIGSDGKRRGRGFTSETARAARRVATEKAAERKRQREEQSLLAGLTARQKLGIAVSSLTQEQLTAVVQNLAANAAQGDVKSVHALARLLDQSFGRAKEEAAPDGRESFERTWEEWSPAERAEYRAALLDQRAREQAARTPSGDESDPRTPGGEGDAPATTREAP